MASHGFVQDLQPTDYAHLLQGGHLKNGKLNGTILEIGPDFMETTKIKGSVIDGETKVHTSTQREGLKESYKTIYQTACSKKRTEDESNETSESSSLFGGENKEKVVKGPQTIVLVSNNAALGDSEAFTSKCRRFSIYSVIILAILLLYIGGTLISDKLKINFWWFTAGYLGVSLLVLPIFFWLLSICVTI